MTKTNSLDYFIGCLLLLMIFFTPSGEISIYYILLSSMLVFFLGVDVLSNKRVNIILISFFIYLILFELYRAVNYTISISVFAEFMRVMFPCFIYLFLKKYKLESTTILSFILLWCICDSMVSALSFLNIRISIIENLYNKNSSLDGLSLSSVRSLGFFPGVAEHGGFFSIIFSWSFVKYFIDGLRERKLLFIVLLSFISLMTSQSKSAIAAAFFSIIIISFFYGKWNVKLFFLLVSSVVLFFLDSLIDKFYHLSKLVIYGLSSSSFQVRISKWTDFMSFSFQDPVLFLFGTGRSLLDNLGSTFDSDYVFIFSVYGLFMVLIVYCFLFRLSLSYSSFGRAKLLNPISLLLTLLISGIAITPLLNPTSQALIVIIYWTCMQDAKILKISTKLSSSER